MVEAFRQALRFLPGMLGCRIGPCPPKPLRQIPGMVSSANSPALKAAARLWSSEAGGALPRICAKGVASCSLPVVAAARTSAQQCSCFTRIAKAMLAYLGAGVAVHSAKQFSGESTLYASEKQSHATWAPGGKPLGSIADARSLWHRAIAATPAKDDAAAAACSSPVPVRLSPSAHPFPNQKLLYGGPPPRAIASVASSYKATLGRDDQSQAGSFQLSASWDSVDVPGMARSPSPIQYSLSNTAHFPVSHAHNSQPGSSPGSPGSDLQWGLSPGRGSSLQEDARCLRQGRPGGEQSFSSGSAGLGPASEDSSRLPLSECGGGRAQGLRDGAIAPAQAAVLGGGIRTVGSPSRGSVTGRFALHGAAPGDALQKEAPSIDGDSSAGHGARWSARRAPELAPETTSCSGSYLMIDETANSAPPRDRSGRSPPVGARSRTAPSRRGTAGAPADGHAASREQSSRHAAAEEGALSLTPIYLPLDVPPPQAPPRTSSPASLGGQGSTSAPPPPALPSTSSAEYAVSRHWPARAPGGLHGEDTVASMAGAPHQDHCTGPDSAVKAPQSDPQAASTRRLIPEGVPLGTAQLGKGLDALAGRGGDVQDVLLEFGEALCHSQTRAREAAWAAAEALAARDRALQAFYYEASMTFAYGQWTAVLQAESTQLRKRAHKDNHVDESARAEFARGKRHAGGRSTAKSNMYSAAGGEKASDGEEVWQSQIACAVGLAFALGLGVGGAVFFLGWSMGLILVAA